MTFAKVVITRFGLVPGPSVDMRNSSFAKAARGIATIAAAPADVAKSDRRVRFEFFIESSSSGL
jgi:hypothetical protein